MVHRWSGSRFYWKAGKSLSSIICWDSFMPGHRNDAIRKPSSWFPENPARHPSWQLWHGDFQSCKGNLALLCTSWQPPQNKQNRASTSSSTLSHPAVWQRISGYLIPTQSGASFGNFGMMRTILPAASASKPLLPTRMHKIPSTVPSPSLMSCMP